LGNAIRFSNLRDVASLLMKLLGLHSDLIAKYIYRIPTSYGGAHCVEVIAKELYLEKFPYKFIKKLKPFQKCALNQKIYAESQWHINKDCKYLFILHFFTLMIINVNLFCMLLNRRCYT
jgi:hypothetical protein